MKFSPRSERPRSAAAGRPILITGGAGFIGSNLADSLLCDGNEVIILDNLSRAGVERNLAWLQSRHGSRVHPCIADVRDARAVDEAVKDAQAVFHLAAQVAVTSILVDPRYDLTVNIEGTLNVLEGLRRHAPKSPLVFASTNKVYGALEHVATEVVGDRHVPRNPRTREFGVDETCPLDFCTPYGCSKGAADQYILDYAHSYGLRSAVLRMSCIYGPRQFGTEDQGWVAHFLIRTLAGEAITIYGDGMQVRDILHVGDAVAAYRGMLAAIDEVKGRAFNLGGGPSNSVSLHALLHEIAAVTGINPALVYEAARNGDQPYFVADTRQIHQAIGWQARMGWRDGLRDLFEWLSSDARTPAEATPMSNVTA
jgi:CDP-paratose 2-epimerase